MAADPESRGHVLEASGRRVCAQRRLSQGTQKQRAGVPDARGVPVLFNRSLDARFERTDPLPTGHELLDLKLVGDAMEPVVRRQVSYQVADDFADAAGILKTTGRCSDA